MGARSGRVIWPLAVVVLSACGGGTEPRAETPLSVAPTTAAPNEQLDDPDCSTAVELFSGELPGGVPGQIVRIAETTNGRWFCLGDGGVDDVTIGLTNSPDAYTPAVTNSGSWNGPGMFYAFQLPSDLPDGLDLADVDGGDLVFARTADGDHLLLIDYTASTQGDPSQDVPRTWQLLDASGAVVLELSAIGPGAGSAPPTFEELYACLEQHGLSPDAPQPYPADVASAAWQACRDLDLAVMAASGMTPQEVEEIVAFVDCMATSGYIQVWLQTDKIDIAAHDAASIACMATRST